MIDTSIPAGDAYANAKDNFILATQIKSVRTFLEGYLANIPFLLAAIIRFINEKNTEI